MIEMSDLTSCAERVKGELSDGTRVTRRDLFAELTKGALGLERGLTGMIVKIRAVLMWCSFVAMPAVGQDVVAGLDSAASTTKETFLIIYRPGPSWLPGKPISEQPLSGHSAYLAALFAKRAMKLAGPFTDNSGGAVLVEVTDESEAHALAANDPAVISGVFVPEIHPWRLVDWQERLKKME